MSTKTRTVVFTDLANYTAKVARSDREGLRRILLEHEEIVTPVVNRYGGRIVKNLGDSFLILFDSATDAVRAALEQTPPELASDIAERGIVLTGGGAMLREMDSVLREATGLPISIAEEPLFCVVMGTGRCLEELKTLRHVLIGA